MFTRTAGVLRLAAWCLAGAVVAAPLAAASDTLELQEAEALALATDPTTARFQAQADSLDQRAVADGQLPDPKLKVGLANFPTDTFSRTQEPMTQVQVGVQQMFPRGDSLAITEARTRILAEEKRASAQDGERQVRKSVRNAWLELYYQHRALAVLRENRALFQQLVDVTQAQYAAGRRNQQDVIRAELELGLLADRETEILAKEDEARAELAKWVGWGEAARELPPDLPGLPPLPPQDALASRLVEHPLLQAEAARIETGRKEVALAREAYKPGWMLDLTYGMRGGNNADGSERADFLSAMVVVDLPVFADKRQDRRLAASQQSLGAAQLARDERLRELKRQLDGSLILWNRLGERLATYENNLLPQARQNSATSLSAYQNDTADFTTLMRARITELDTRLKALRLRVDRAKAQASLLYLVGDAL